MLHSGGLNNLHRNHNQGKQQITQLNVDYRCTADQRHNAHWECGSLLDFFDKTISFNSMKNTKTNIYVICEEKEIYATKQVSFLY